MFIGQVVRIGFKTDGNGRRIKLNTPVKDKITQIYADGTVQVSSGDVYEVVKGSKGLVAIK